MLKPYEPSFWWVCAWCNHERERIMEACDFCGARSLLRTNEKLNVVGFMKNKYKKEAIKGQPIKEPSKRKEPKERKLLF